MELMRGGPTSASPVVPLIRTSTRNAKSVLLVSKRGNNSYRNNSNRINSNRNPQKNDSNSRRLGGENSREGSGRKAMVGAVDSNSACGGGGGAGNNINDSNSRRLAGGNSHDSNGGSGGDNNGIGGTNNCWGGSDFVIISCKDSGAGLSKENLSQLFKEGVQFKANELQGGGGSGLGLFITKGVIPVSIPYQYYLFIQPIHSSKYLLSSSLFFPSLFHHIIHDRHCRTA